MLSWIILGTLNVSDFSEDFSDVLATRGYPSSRQLKQQHPSKLISPTLINNIRNVSASRRLDPFMYDSSLGVWYTTVISGRVIVVALSFQDAVFSQVLVLSVLHAISHVMHGIFQTTLSPSLIKQNFGRFYSILDEVIFAGFPFLLEPNVIECTVPEIPKVDGQTGIIKKLTSAVIGPTETSMQPLLDNAITGISPDIWWRRSGIIHHTNEFYIDVTDTIHCILSADGKLVSGTITGALSGKSKLSGNPELLLTFKDPNLVKPMISFHPCVRIPRWKRDTRLSFVPPDGQFTLAEYTIMDRSKIVLPFHLKAHVDDTGKFSVTISPRLNVLNQSSIENLTAIVRVGKSVTSATLFTQQGSVKFDSESHTVSWSIGTMKHSNVEGFKMEGVLRGLVKRNACTVSARFRVPGWSVSGVRIESVNVTGVNYTPYKGVRYATVGGRIDVRI